MNEDYEIYIITLKENNKLKNNILDKKFKNINYFYGINGNKLSRKEINKYTNTIGKYIPKPAFGCFSSHFLLWKYILQNSKKENIIILEDDTIIDYDKFKSQYNIINSLLNTNNIIFLYQDHLKSKNKITHIKHIYSTGAYIVNKKIVNLLYNYYMKNGIDTHIDKSLNTSLKRLKLKPLLVDIGNTYKENSNMMNNKNNRKYFLKSLNTDTYYEILFPYFNFNNVTINIYSIIIILLIIIGFIYTLIISKLKFYNTISHIILCIYFFVIGILVWDGFELFNTVQ